MPRTKTQEFPFGPLSFRENEVGQLHNRDGEYAFVSPVRCAQFRNGRQHGVDADIYGRAHYYAFGVLVTKEIFNNELTPRQILKLPNAEQRYAAMQIHGVENLVSEGKVIHTDADIDARLVEFKLSDQLSGRFVIVKDGTPKPDGTYRRYALQVPPDTTTCRQAIAWTFRKDEKDYKPEKET